MAKPKTVALLRVSSAAQAGPDKQGLPVQRETCQRIAKTHGLRIVDWVELDGVSGAAVLGDPRFSALLRRIESPDIHGVVVGAFDRLFRRGRFSDYAILDAFAETGTVLYTPDGRQDLNSESDGLLSVLRGELAGMERRRITERTQKGRERKRREKGIRAEGLVGMPRGVTMDRETETWAYVHPEADRVRQVFELFLSGTTNFAEIHRQVGFQSCVEPSGVISRILRQPLYKGIYRVDKKWLGGGRWVPRDPEECYEHPVLDPPLIDLADWDRVQALMDEKASRRAPITNPEDRDATYVGHVDCGLCGVAMQTHRSSNGYWSYFCPNTLKGCKRGYSSARSADRQIDEQLEEVLSDKTTLLRLIEEAGQKGEQRAASPPAETVRKITELKNQRARVKDAYVEGVFGLKECEKRLAGIEGDIAILEGLLEPPERQEIAAEAARQVVTAFALWRLQTREEKRAHLRALHLRIWTSKPGRGKVKIEKVRIGLLGEVALYN